MLLGGGVVGVVGSVVVAGEGAVPVTGVVLLGGVVPGVTLVVVLGAVVLAPGGGTVVMPGVPGVPHGFPEVTPGVPMVLAEVGVEVGLAGLVVPGVVPGALWPTGVPPLLDDVVAVAPVAVPVVVVPVMHGFNAPAGVVEGAGLADVGIVVAPGIVVVVPGVVCVVPMVLGGVGAGEVPAAGLCVGVEVPVVVPGMVLCAIATAAASSSPIASAKIRVRMNSLQPLRCYGVSLARWPPKSRRCSNRRLPA